MITCLMVTPPPKKKTKQKIKLKKKIYDEQILRSKTMVAKSVNHMTFRHPRYVHSWFPCNAA